MPYEDSKIHQLVLNVLPQEQYNQTTKNENELYLIKDIDNSEVFVATYESTTFEEITNALNKEKICICQNTTNDGKFQQGQLVIIENNAYYFEASSSTENISKDFLKITSDNIWTSQNVEVKINSTTEISNSSTNEEFPTAAASYNFVNNNYLSKNNPEGTGSFSLNRKTDTEIGDYSCAVGYNITASGEASHAEGEKTTAFGWASHAEGQSYNILPSTITTESTDEEIIMEWDNTAFAYAKGANSHTEGRNCLALKESSHAEGGRTAALADSAHSEGGYTTASGNYSHAEGASSTASGNNSHAEGYSTTASGVNSHAEGYNTTAAGSSSHAEGYETTASENNSHAAGYGTIALANQYAIGHYNNTSLAQAATSSGSGGGTGTEETLFVIGNGTSSSKANAFRVNQYGKVYGKSSYVSSGADYAEFFEWEDGNLNEEDRRGYFVTLDGKKIKIANPGEYILGVVSAMPAVIGNGDEDWMNRYVTDEFGAFVYEEFEYEEKIIENDNITTIIKTGLKHKENPNYDPTIKYIPREKRPEWDTIGMMGVLAVRDDGSCLVNEYCQVAEGGIASYAINGYRVIERVNDHVVKIIFK